MTGARPDLLEAILAATRARVEAARARRPAAELERAARERTPNGQAFVSALSDRSRVNIMAECKRRSPSRGVLRAAYDPVEIARGYTRAGAAGVSVLTDPAFFDGSLDDLARVRQATPLPLLRKDFIVDEYQLLEARAAGADAALLIAAALTDAALVRLAREAETLGLAVLVEVHDVRECDRALAAGARVIGVNNRNLRTLEVDLDVSHAVAARVPQDRIAVSESGFRTADELKAMRQVGYRAFLIGERFMTEPDPGAALAGLLASLESAL
jgi:indole-3-glycerol phosphate synthase